jgi:hypothetical protein
MFQSRVAQIQNSIHENKKDFCKTSIFRIPRNSAEFNAHSNVRSEEWKKQKFLRISMETLLSATAIFLLYLTPKD